jgi:hypothetical protein
MATMRALLLAFLSAGLALGTGTALAHGDYQQLPADGASGAGQTPDGAVDLESLKKLGCPAGLENILPGIYYYCVGARDLAENRNAQGLSMLETAAAWGSKPAQYTLGVGYFNGDVAVKNRPLGLAWLGLAAERKDPYYLATFQSAWRKATPTEQIQANALWNQMRRKYGDAVAATRSQRHYQYLRDQMISGETLGARWCIAGLTARAVTPPDSPLVGPGAQSHCDNGWPGNVLAKRLDKYADSLFDGLQGHVTVGPLLQVSPPGTYQRKPDESHTKY